MSVNSRLKDIDLNPKTSTTEPLDGILHLRETSLDMGWGAEHFRLVFVFLVAGLVSVGWESLNFSNAPNNEMKK